MKRGIAVALLASLTFLGAAPARAADGAELYRTYCASCHQEDGQGVPGTYPFIDGPIGRLSTLPEGREALLAIVLFGLKGELVQRGVTYNGVMPGYAAAMSDEEVAALLNWLKAQWRNANFGAKAPDYTPEEVARVRSLGLKPEEVMGKLREVEKILHANRPQGHGQGNCPDHARHSGGADRTPPAGKGPRR